MSQTANNMQNLFALQDPHSLMSAFEQFGRLSEQLQQSYQDLDRRAAELTRQLAQAQDERLEQLAQKEKLADRLETLLTALPAGVVVLNRDGIIHTANRAASEVFECALIGEAWQTLLQNRLRSYEAHDVILNNGKVVNLSRQPLETDGEEIILIHDVSHTRMLQDLAGRQQRLAAMGQMAAGLGHQLRTPLSSALLYIAQVHNPALNTDQQHRAADKIRASLRYLEKLINDMLMYAKGGEFANASFNVGQLLIAFNARFEARLQQSGSTLNIDCKQSDLHLRGSIDALISVLINLAENAVEACNGPCQLTLMVYEQSGFLILAMRDNGPGLSAEQQLHIFEPFYTDKDRGTGLGLAVAQAIAHAHQGDLLVKSEPGQGSTFYLCLPLDTGEQFLPSGQMTTSINQAGQSSGDDQ